MIVFFAMSLLSKSALVIFPLALLVVDWFPLRRLDVSVSIFRTILKKVPLMILSVIVASLFRTQLRLRFAWGTGAGNG